MKTRLRASKEPTKNFGQCDLNYGKMRPEKCIICELKSFGNSGKGVQQKVFSCFFLLCLIQLLLPMGQRSNKGTAAIVSFWDHRLLTSLESQESSHLEISHSRWWRDFQKEAKAICQSAKTGSLPVVLRSWLILIKVMISKTGYWLKSRSLQHLKKKC